jgi:hypothetical protein
MQNSYAIIQNPIAFAWQPFLALFFLRSEWVSQGLQFEERN